MSQTIQVQIGGRFPAYSISFSAQPAPVPYPSTQTITYQMGSPGFQIIGVNLQRDPFASTDELTWAIPAGGLSLILTDVNQDKSATTFGMELIFADGAGNVFSSVDPEVVNEGEQ